MIKKLKSEIVTSVKNRKINVFILFLLFAFIILIFTKLSKDYTNTLVFNIDKVNVPQENVIINDSSAKLSVTLKTHGFKWLSYYLKKPKITIDFDKDVYKKDSVFVWSKSRAFLNNTQFDKQVQLLNINPDTLFFRYDVNLIKTVPVVLNSEITYSQGYDASSTFILDPDSIQVIGPKIVVSKIENLETDKLVLSDIRTDIVESVKLKGPKDNSEIKFSSDNVDLRVTVEKFTEGTLKIPVSVINVPNSIKLKYFPKEISVSFYVSLTNFNSIEAKDFRVECDYNTVNNSSFLIPELVEFPKNVKHAKISQKRIEFIISE